MNEETHQSGETLPAVQETGRDTEAALLGNRLAQVYEGRVQDFIRYVKMQPDEAARRGRQTRVPYSVEELRTLTPERVQWEDIEKMQESDPQQAWERWDSILSYAEQRVRGGIMGAAAVGNATPFQQAEYMAVRDELGIDWKPRNGIESVLIEQMATAHLQFLRWQQTMIALLSSEEWEAPKNAAPLPPRVTTAQAVEQAGQMVDKFSRIFLRTLRALVNMRRVPIIVQNAGQVNVGQQQVNVAQVAAANEGT